MVFYSFEETSGTVWPTGKMIAVNMLTYLAKGSSLLCGVIVLFAVLSVVWVLIKNNRDMQ